MNSCWEIDEFFAKRSSIYSKALTRGLQTAEEQIKQAKDENILPRDAKILRIAIWHHPVTGNDAIANDAFLDRLRQANFRFCLHGHVHEARTDLIGYISQSRRIHVTGAGSFGANMADRPESTPRLYNIIEIPKDLSEIKVHTRCLRKEDGAWDAWAYWEGNSPEERLSYYRIPVLDSLRRLTRCSILSRI